MKLVPFEMARDGSVIHIDPLEVLYVSELEGREGKKAATIALGDGQRFTVKDDNRDAATKINEARLEIENQRYTTTEEIDHT